MNFVPHDCSHIYSSRIRFGEPFQNGRHRLVKYVVKFDSEYNLQRRSLGVQVCFLPKKKRISYIVTLQGQRCKKLMSFIYQVSCESICVLKYIIIFKRIHKNLEAICVVIKIYIRHVICYIALNRSKTFYVPLPDYYGELCSFPGFLWYKSCLNKYSKSYISVHIITSINPVSIT